MEQSAEYDWFGPDAATFGDRVAGAREVTGMTQVELARRLGIKLATLQGWEDDVSEPRANKLQMLSGLLNVSLSWLLSGQGDGPDAPPQEEPELTPELHDLLMSMRTLKTDMIKSADKLAHLEKQIRKHLRDQI